MNLLEHIRQRRRAGLARRRHRLPRVAVPRGLQVQYWKAIRSLTVEPARAAVERVLLDIKRLLPARTDAPGESSQAARTIERVADEFTDAFRPRQAEQIARQFAERTSETHFDQTRRQLRAALGVDVPLDAPVTALLDDHVAANIALIKSIPSEYFDQVRRIVVDGVTSGERWEDLAKRIDARFPVADNRARLIARDQTGKLFGALAKVRQQHLGIRKFVWTTVHDDRVRDEHVELDGQTFPWDNPPDEGYPGQPVNCRCFAAPDVDSLLDELEAG